MKKNKDEKKDELKRFLEFVSAPKTKEELRKEFGKTKVIIGMMDEAKSAGYKMLRSGGKIHFEKVIPFDTEAAIKNRSFKTLEAYDDNGNFFVPGRLIVFYPKDWEKIRIVPIADVFWGEALCDTERLKKIVRWISRDEHVFCYLSGNIFSSKIAASDLGKKVEDLEKLFEPMFNKILFTVSGPNEEKFRKLKPSKKLPKGGFDPLASMFNGSITHFLDQAHIAIKFDGIPHVMKLFAIHGKSNAIITGAKVNAVYRLISSFDADVYSMANLKASHIEKPEIISFRTDGQGLDIKKVYLISLPTFKKYFGSDDAVRGNPPPFEGQINIAFYGKTGDIHVYSGTLKKEEEVII
ncbi:MAG: hypothetical protein M1334_04020 [Patescibacteria group bacterium]|nr:hypothetical protein [Patescibacteria group bacterium]